MTAQRSCDAILDDALNGLLSMAPDRIQSAELALRQWQENGMAPDAVSLQRLKLLRSAAIGAAQLWRESIPQPGYTPAGPAEQTAAASSLSVTA